MRLPKREKFQSACYGVSAEFVGPKRKIVYKHIGIDGCHKFISWQALRDAEHIRDTEHNNDYIRCPHCNKIMK